MRSKINCASTLPTSTASVEEEQDTIEPKDPFRNKCRSLNLPEQVNLNRVSSPFL